MGKKNIKNLVRDMQDKALTQYHSYRKAEEVVRQLLHNEKEEMKELGDLFLKNLGFTLNKDVVVNTTSNNSTLLQDQYNVTGRLAGCDIVVYQSQVKTVVHFHPIIYLYKKNSQKLCKNPLKANWMLPFVLTQDNVSWFQPGQSL